MQSDTNVNTVNKTNMIHTRNNKVQIASILPSVLNLNPRSIYNKVDEFKTFIQEYEIDITFISE